MRHFCAFGAPLALQACRSHLIHQPELLGAGQQKRQTVTGAGWKRHPAENRQLDPEGDWQRFLGFREEVGTENEGAVEALRLHRRRGEWGSITSDSHSPAAFLGVAFCNTCCGFAHQSLPQHAPAAGKASCFLRIAAKFQARGQRYLVPGGSSGFSTRTRSLAGVASPPSAFAAEPRRRPGLSIPGRRVFIAIRLGSLRI